MKRSEAIEKLIPKVISPFDKISKDNHDVYKRRAERLLDFIEKELGMLPPSAVMDMGDTHVLVNSWEFE